MKLRGWMGWMRCRWRESGTGSLKRPQNGNSISELLNGGRQAEEDRRSPRVVRGPFRSLQSEVSHDEHLSAEGS
jgi:hypothetical protein